MHIYFLEDEDTKQIKIGRSGNVKDRIRSVRVEFKKDRLLLLGLIKKSAPFEKVTQQRFAHLPNRKEWFTPDVDLYTFILEHAIADLPSDEDKNAAIERIRQRLDDNHHPYTKLLIQNTELRRQLATPAYNTEELEARCESAEARANRLNEALSVSQLAVSELNRRIESLVKANAEEWEEVRKAAISKADVLLVRERDRLLKTNAYLLERNKHLCAVNNDLRDQLRFVQLPLPLARESEAV